MVLTWAIKLNTVTVKKGPNFFGFLGSVLKTVNYGLNE